MILILDFDGVVFDDVRFKKDYAAVFRRFGVPLRAYQDTYDAARKMPAGYAPAAQIVLLKKKYPKIRSGALAGEIKKLTARSRMHLYPDTRHFLFACWKMRLPMILVSTGSSFQKQKITASRTGSFFKKVIIVAGGKKSAPIKKIRTQFPKKKLLFLKARFRR